MSVHTDRILLAVRAIPRGEVAAYGEIARRAGLPRRARLVARVLSQCDDPDLPWHRVVRADGRIAFEQSAPQFAEQCARLRGEGVMVEGGRVRSWRPLSVDELVWGEPRHDA
ncbi:MAG: hypothetical protein AVDCRST_MAG71-771 [uncultured Lysobacter sp.]|uniref:Methylated-DNA-[protein]-cysteine S-methyltransferase DNA binding domain-containing protein n=1 Tax=uncultured Lysobacter sp. TaxID=271060 RepID=A0A6J4KSK3_9GAMM|nr:MAG: hypothetical protein AVDCRST_MAG71-771 [uncultured Lysobacter sp.]